MKKSWDGWAYADKSAGENTMHEHPSGGTRTVPVRVVPWSCPYPPEQVPQVGELVGDVGTVLTTPFQSGTGAWYVRIKGFVTTDHFNQNVDTILILPSPTIEIGGKRYNEAAVIERCKELEEV